jgi:putative SOS response-associated peptidase YedK
MCGRFEQSGTRRYYASALGVDTTGREWSWSDHIPSYNVASGLYPWMLTVHDGELEFSGIRWGYRTPDLLPSLMN